MKYITTILLILTSCLAAENISHFNIACNDNVIMQSKALKPDNVYMIAVFPDICFPCNQNRFLLDKLSKIKGLKSYGVFLTDKMYYSFCELKLVKFDVYYCIEQKKFIKGLQINSKKFYTIITKGSKVLYKKAGDFYYQDYKIIRDIVRRNNE